MDLRAMLALLETKQLRILKFDKSGGTISGATNIDTASGHITLKESGTTKFTLQSVGSVFKITDAGGVDRITLDSSKVSSTYDIYVKKGTPALYFDVSRADGKVARLFWNANSTSDFGFYIDSGFMALMFDNANQILKFSKDKTTYYEVLHKGNAPAPSYEDSTKVSSFRASRSSLITTLTTTGTFQNVTFNAEDWDNKNEWDGASVFTAAADGIYQFYSYMKVNPNGTSGAGLAAQLLINNSGGTQKDTKRMGETVLGSTTKSQCLQGCVQVKLSAGDKCYLQIYTDTANVQLDGTYGTWVNFGATRLN